MSMLVFRAWGWNCRAFFRSLSFALSFTHTLSFPRSAMLNHTESPIKRLSPDLVLNVTTSLDLKSLLTLASTCKHFKDLALSDLVFRRLVERDYGITYKRPESDQTWKEFFKTLYTKEAKPCCAHLSKVPDEPSETKRVLYHAALERSLRCDYCRSQDAVYLNLDASSDAQGAFFCIVQCNYSRC